MKERLEMLCERVEGGLRAEVEVELTAKLSSEMQERLKGGTNQVGRATPTRVGTTSA